MIHTKLKIEKEDLFMRTIWLAMIILLATIFAGCQMGDRTDDETGMRDPNVERTRYQDDTDRTTQQDRRDTVQRRDRDRTTDRNHTTERGHHRSADRDRDDKRDNRSYDVQKEAADRITDEISEINHAYVLTNDRNAYVAATLDNDRDQDQTSKDDKTNREHMTSKGNDNMPTRKGRSRAESSTDNDDNMRSTEGNKSGQTRTEGLDDHEAGEELTDDIKKEIKEIVQSVDNNIENVYVSTNPDFADLTNNYINDFNEGKPVRGMFDQLGNMIERLFPQNRR